MTKTVSKATRRKLWWAVGTVAVAALFYKPASANELVYSAIKSPLDCPAVLTTVDPADTNLPHRAFAD